MEIQATDEPASVVLVDDHPFIVEGLVSLIGKDPSLHMAGTASTLAAAHALLRKIHPALLVMDIGLPDGNGLGALGRFLAETPDLLVVVFTFHADPGHLQRALEAQARGYVLKTSDPSTVLQAIHAVRRGGIYIDPTLMERALRARPGAHPDQGVPLEAQLSSREVDVLRMTAFGYSIKEISEELGISPKSVETYKSRASAKLELPSRAAIVRYAVARGWFDTAS